MKKGLYFIFILSINIQAHTSSCFTKFKPTVSVNVQDTSNYYRKFVSKHGPLETFSNLKKYLKNLCSPKHHSNNSSFKPSDMYSFIITDQCKVILSFNAQNGKKVRHAALANEEVIIGGGEIKCFGERFSITNRSNQYCFPIQPISILVEDMLKLGYISSNILIKFKQKKMCAIKKGKRIQKYKKIIRKDYIDFGYKKNQTYRANEFLNRLGPKYSIRN